MSLNSLQDNMSRRAASMAAMAKRANNPQEIQAIQKSLVAGVQNGSIQPYVGIPLIQELTQKLTEAKAQMAQSMAGAGMPQATQGQQAPQPPIAQQVMQQAAQESQGLEALPSNLPQEYAGGGIIAFEEGGEVERYQNQGLVPNMSGLPAYSATNPNAAMGEFLKKFGISAAEFANARPEVQKDLFDMFRSTSEAPKPMGASVTAPATPTAPATSGSYRAGQAVGQAVRGGAAGTGNFLSRGLMGMIGGPATGAIGLALTPSSIADNQAVLAALRGEGYRGQPYDVLNARKILEAAGMDPNKAPVAPAVVNPTDARLAANKQVAPSAAPAAPVAVAPARPAAPVAGGPQTSVNASMSMKETAFPGLTDLDAITKRLPADTKAATEDAVTKTQKMYEDMDKPGFEAREGRLGKREAEQEKNSAISRALIGIKTGLRIAGSKERTLAGAFGKEGSEGIEDLIRGEAANRAAKDKLEDYRDNLEQQKVAAKKGNYQAAQAAGERAADNLYKYTTLNLNAAQAGNTQAIQRYEAEGNQAFRKASVEQGIAGIKLKEKELAQTGAFQQGSLKLGQEKLNVLKSQIAAGNERAKATLMQAENKIASTWQSSPDYQKAQAQSKKMPPIEAQRYMQQAFTQYRGNMLPSLLATEGGGANIPSFADAMKAME
jgi:hypothetical protein